MAKAEIIQSGSKGNCVVYNDMIAVDLGVPFSKIEHVYKDLCIILLTHQHLDHINPATIQKLADLRPTLRFGCCEWMADKLIGIKNVDIFEIGEVYDYGVFKISPIKLYHDVPNCGYRIFMNNEKIIHATDTATLKGISAKGYDIYAIEHNYDEDTIQKSIEEAEAKSGFSHQKGAINSHLSEQQAREFIYNNRKPESQVIRLHESSTSL